MIVRSEPRYVRRRRIALLVVLALVVLAVLGVSRLVGLLSDGTAEAAPPARAAATTTATTAPPAPSPAVEDVEVPAPKPSPAETQGSAGSSAETALVRTMRLTGDLASKSVVASGHGLLFAQNMMYRHSVSVFRADGALVKTIGDSVDLGAFGIKGHPGISQGAPVEVAFSPDGRYAWVSNYSMYGAGFGPEGLDTCQAGDGTDESFVYRVDTATLAIDKVVPVGAVPKYVAVTPDGKQVLVTNWCGDDVSVIDAATATEVARVPLLGKHPRGIALAPDGTQAYIALMGSDRVVRMDLSTRKVYAYAETGDGPRHLVATPDGKHVFVTNANAGTVTKLDRRSGKVLATATVGRQPRSMAMSPDGGALYTVNYDSASVTKLRTSDLAVVDEVRTDAHPIGITYEPTKKAVWVACYGGSILVFDDSRRPVA